MRAQLTANLRATIPVGSPIAKQRAISALALREPVQPGSKVDANCGQLGRRRMPRFNQEFRRPQTARPRSLNLPTSRGIQTVAAPRRT